MGVVVFANSRTDSGALPAGAMEVRAKGGNTIPMVFVTTADGAKGIDAIPYATLKNDMRKSVRTLRSTLDETDVLGGESLAENPATQEPASGDVPEFITWTNTAGKSIRAAASKVQDGKVLFLLPNGKTVWYEISKLSEKSQDNLPGE